MIKFLSKVILVAFISWLVLEGIAQLVWWGRSCVTLFGKNVCLLPEPLLTLEQREAIEDLKEARYHQFDPLLGWSIRPNSRVRNDDIIYASNDIGIRSPRHFDRTPPPGVTRLAAFGPSFVHGDEVAYESTWEYHIERQRPDLEVMNWGVNGYGTDQAFLRYQTQGAAYAPHVVIIGFEEESQLRNVNRFRPFYAFGTGIPLTKPMFVLDGDGLRLLSNPFSSLTQLAEKIRIDPNGFLDVVCPYDLFCDAERYRTSPWDVIKSYRVLHTLAFELGRANGAPSIEQQAQREETIKQTSLRLVHLFVDTVRKNGSIPVLVMFPGRGTVERYQKGQAPAYAEGVRLLQNQGIYVLDLAASFVEANGPNLDFTHLFAPGGHYNDAGNQVVSRAIINFLCQQQIIGGCGTPK